MTRLDMGMHVLEKMRPREIVPNRSGVGYWFLAPPGDLVSFFCVPKSF